MGEIWFIRHGQASFRTHDYDRLSPLGHQQSDWLGAHLASLRVTFDHVICGTLRRHRETAEGVLRHIGDRTFSQDRRLNEMAYSQIETGYITQHQDPLPSDDAELPKHFMKVMRAWQNNEITDPPELFSEFSSRIADAIADAAKVGKRVLIVSSGGPKGILMRNVLGLDDQALNDVILSTHNSALSRFNLIDGTLKLAQFNAIPHLDAEDRAFARTYI